MVLNTTVDRPPPATPGGPQSVFHTWRYVPTSSSGARTQLNLEVVAGAGQTGWRDLRALRAVEPSARVLGDVRPGRTVYLLRDHAASGGLTIVSWLEGPRLSVSVLGRGDVSLAQVVQAARTAVVAPAAR